MLPSNERADELRNLYSEHVEPLNDDLYNPWKGNVEAVVPEELASDVAEAMNFIGSIVDERTERDDGMVRLFSLGYYHHIGA